MDWQCLLFRGEESCGSCIVSKYLLRRLSLTSKIVQFDPQLSIMTLKFARLPFLFQLTRDLTIFIKKTLRKPHASLFFFGSCNFYLFNSKVFPMLFTSNIKYIFAFSKWLKIVSIKVINHCRNSQRKEESLI